MPASSTMPASLRKVDPALIRAYLPIVEYKAGRGLLAGQGEAVPNYVKPELRGAASILWDSQEPEVIICGPAETGKTWAAVSKLNALMWDYPGSQAVIIRKVYAVMNSTVLQTFKRVLGKNSGVRVYGGERPEWYDYPNGSRVWVAGMDNPGKALSSERDFIYINQAEELGKFDYETLTTRNTGRGSIAPFTQTFGDCNPAGINHWILERQKEKHLTLLQSFHEDNPTLYDAEGNITEQGIRTMNRLDALSGILKKRLRLGQWGVPAGLIYDCFVNAHPPEGHVIPAFTLPDEWPRYGGLDFGGSNTAALLIAQEPSSGINYVFWEYHAGNKTAAGHTASILAHSTNQKGETIVPLFVGGAGSEDQWRREFKIAGLPVATSGVTSVEVGINRAYSLIKQGKLRVFDTCKGFIDDLQSYSRKLDPTGEPTEEIENKSTWHRVDAFRYIASRLAGGAASGA